MEKTILRNVEPLEKIQILRSSCETTEEFDYQKKFDANELSVKKDQAIFKTAEVSRLIKNKTETVSELTKAIKFAKEEQEMLIDQAKTGHEQVTETVYLISDHEVKMMGYYTEKGVLVYERPLLPSEMQTNMLHKVASNDQ